MPRNDKKLDMFLKAYNYYEGKDGVRQNYPQAFKLFRVLALDDDQEAQYMLGIMYKFGEGVLQSDAKAVHWFQNAANQGNAAAQYQLAISYKQGQGVPQDDTKAVQWFLKAAKQEDADAQRQLGIMYRFGRGVPQDDTKAVQWFLKAAKQEDADAQANLGLMYKQGQGVPQNDAKAAEWLQKAANQGNARAQANLGLMYKQGQGVPQNYAKAVQWLQKSANQGNAKGQANLGYMYQEGQGVPQNYAKAAEWLQKAADQGNAGAQAQLGVMYYQGQGVPQNYAKAIEWLQKAADQENTLAQVNLGLMYKKGQGVLQNDAKAIEWFQKAADKGDTDIQKILIAYKELISQKGESLSSIKEATLTTSLDSPPSTSSSSTSHPALPAAYAYPKILPVAPMSPSLSSPQPSASELLTIAYKELSLGAELGRGGFGIVFKGSWQSKPVAVKTLSAPELPPKAKQDFIDEATTMNTLRHPHIVELFGITLDHTPYCMVMELLENGSLYGYLQSARPLDKSLQLQLAVDITQGLAYLHSQSILHRDLKSLNVLLDGQLRAKLGDFGLSKIRNHTLSMTTSGKMVGTAQWMAPELFDMEDESNKGSEKSDMYSYGMILWELASRKVPFATARNQMQVGMWVMQGKRETIPADCSPSLSQLIQACWEALPSKRPTAAQALTQLQPIPTYSSSSSSTSSGYQGNLVSGIPSTERYNPYSTTSLPTAPLSNSSLNSVYQNNLASGAGNPSVNLSETSKPAAPTATSFFKGVTNSLSKMTLGSSYPAAHRLGKK